AFTGMAHAKFRYAGHAHARIRRIDTTRARALPGVVAVVTQEDLPEVRFGGLVQDRTLFAKDVVRFDGEIVAGVAALTEAIAAEVTIWPSTQLPSAARAGVAQTLQVPEANVRVVVPLLGGGFGAKCDLHFEAQVAALARAARRPVRLVFSREEEFTAIAQRREGIVMEFETGATRDGHLVARKARLVLDKGAYCGEGGFLGQMAAMAACGPYQIDTISVEAHLNYTNNQPSGSVRAPTAPQVCWGLEQHMD